MEQPDRIEKYPNPNLTPHIGAVHDYVFDHIRYTGVRPGPFLVIELSRLRKSEKAFLP